MKGTRSEARFLAERLSLILDWYQGMVSGRTGRLIYSYDPEREVLLEDRNPIRDIASIWDVEQVSAFLGRSELTQMTEESLEHHSANSSTWSAASTQSGDPPRSSSSALEGLLALAEALLVFIFLMHPARSREKHGERRNTRTTAVTDRAVW